jgi:hypothetical protein
MYFKLSCLNGKDEIFFISLQIKSSSKPPWCFIFFDIKERLKVFLLVNFFKLAFYLKKIKKKTQFRAKLIDFSLVYRQRKPYLILLKREVIYVN